MKKAFGLMMLLGLVIIFSAGEPVEKLKVVKGHKGLHVYCICDGTGGIRCLFRVGTKIIKPDEMVGYNGEDDNFYYFKTEEDINGDLICSDSGTYDIQIPRAMLDQILEE